MKNTDTQGLMKKKHERLAVEPVINSLGLNGSDLKDSESPDFILSYCNRNIGIEVVSYGNELKESEHAFQKVLEEYAKSLDKQSTKKYYISVIPKFGYIQPIDYKKANKKIHEELNGLYNGTLTEEQSTFFDGASFVEVNNSECIKSVILTDGYWEYNDVNHENLLSLIKKKERKLKTYKELHHDINVFWLIVSVPYSSRTGIKNKIKSSEHFVSGYNRIYLTDEADCILYYQDDRNCYDACKDTTI